MCVGCIYPSHTPKKAVIYKNKPFFMICATEFVNHSYLAYVDAVRTCLL